MNNVIYTIEKNEEIAENTFEAQLSGDTSEIKRPGTFVNIRLDGLYLRRPISVCDFKDGELVIIYKAVGRGTFQLSRMKKGESLDVLAGLGNGYDTEKSGKNVLLIGGGAGVPPLFGLSERLIKEGKGVTAVLGFNTGAEVFYEDKFKKAGANVFVTTVDGSFGEKGFVTDIMPRLEYDYFYTCGPMPMLRAVDRAAKTDGQLSFEERMGCGFGLCMGCSCKTRYGSKRICKDGPVLFREEIIW